MFNRPAMVGGGSSLVEGPAWLRVVEGPHLRVAEKEVLGNTA